MQTVLVGDCLDILAGRSGFEAVVLQREVYAVVLDDVVATRTEANKVRYVMRIVRAVEHSDRPNVVDVKSPVLLNHQASSTCAPVARPCRAPGGPPFGAIVFRVSAFPLRSIGPHAVGVAASDRAEGFAGLANPPVGRVVELAPAVLASEHAQHSFPFRATRRHHHGRLALRGISVGLAHDALCVAERPPGVVAFAGTERGAVLWPRSFRAISCNANAARGAHENRSVRQRARHCRVAALARARLLVPPLDPSLLPSERLAAHWTRRFDDSRHRSAVYQ